MRLGKRSLSIFAVIPVKILSEAKTRLAQILTSAERSELVVSMLRDVLEAVTNASALERVLVISADDTVLRLAHQYKAKSLREKAPTGLNSAVKQATDWCIANDAEGVLTLLADIPLITSTDVTEIISVSKQEPMVVIAPSKNEDGTNALLRKPPYVIPTYYGQKSFRLHLQEAIKRKLPYSIYRSSRMAFDIDTIEDLIMFCESGDKTWTHKFAMEHEIAEKIHLRI